MIRIVVSTARGYNNNVNGAYGITGTYREGKIVLDQRVDWPDGSPVKVVCLSETPDAVQSDGQDFCFDGSACEDTPDAVRQWIEWFDSLEPALSGAELERFEQNLRAARNDEKALLPNWQRRADNLVK